MRRDPLALGALGALIAGSLVMFGFDVWFTRLTGVLLLFAAIVLGVFAIATPEFLVDDEEDQEPV